MARPTLPRKSDNYAFLLAGLLILFLLVPLLRTFSAIERNSFFIRIGVQVGYSALMLIGVWSLYHENRIFRLGMALVILNIILIISQNFYDYFFIELCAQSMVLLFSVMSAVIAVKHVFGSIEINRNMLFGAMCVYLLLGLIWAILYGIIFQFWPLSFKGFDTFGGSVPLDQLLYYSFVTLASLGYGDITPLSPLAQTLSYLEVVCGQFYIAIMLSLLVGLYLKKS